MRIPRARLVAPLLAVLVGLPGLAVVTAAPASAAAQVLTPVVPGAVQERQILDGINAERAKVGAGPVTLDPTLEVVAQDWADALGQGDGMKHNPRLGTLLADFPQWGEIVATADMGNADTKGLENGVLAVDSWMKSDPHRVVLQDRKYSSIGIGLVYTTLWSGGRTVWRSYWVADFGTPRRTPLVAQNADGSRSFAGIPVKGAILDTYTRTGANGGFLGLPMGRELGPLTRGGFGQPFAGGSVYWSPASGAAVVRGAIRDRWAGLGWENSWLGYPTGEEFGVRGGVVQRFQGGLVYFSPATGAQAVRGAIAATYGATGWENGFLGFPTTSEQPLRAGAFSHFQGGSVYWSPATGAQTVAGSFRDFWAARGWENSGFGYPTSSAFGGLTGGGWGQRFQGGSLYVSAATGVHSVAGAVRDAWAAQGWENGRLGYPKSEPYPVSGGTRQDFTGGAITVVGGAASVTLA